MKQNHRFKATRKRTVGVEDVLGMQDKQSSWMLVLSVKPLCSYLGQRAQPKLCSNNAFHESRAVKVQGHSRPEQGPPVQDKTKMTACQNDQPRLSQTWTKRGVLCRFNTFSVGTCCVPQGSQSLRTQAGARQMGPVCAWHYMCHQWGTDTAPLCAQPLCSCFFQAEQKGKNNKILIIPTYLSVQPGAGRVTTLVKSIFFPPRWKLYIHISKEMPKV